MRIAATIIASGNTPCALSAHPRMPVRGTSPLFTIIRICVSGLELYESTKGTCERERRGMEKRRVRWNWALGARGRGTRCGMRGSVGCGSQGAVRPARSSLCSTPRTLHTSATCTYEHKQHRDRRRIVDRYDFVRRVHMETLPKLERVRVVRERRSR